MDEHDAAISQAEKGKTRQRQALIAFVEELAILAADLWFSGKHGVPSDASKSSHLGEPPAQRERPESTTSASTDKDPSLWDVADVATYLKVSRSWVYHQAESGRMPYFRIGNLLRFDPEDIKAFARQRAAGSYRPAKLGTASRHAR
ncbi:MAG TPA: helix-turn-helix domain-containing protein [Polyangiaceae bacterium]|nr:helix-turn-helix domain-containing protein [Polyangiaceae bacterium]